MNDKRQREEAIRATGFTLIEVMVVVGIIAVISAIVLPQLLPALAFSTHEGAARRILGYGRSAIAYAGWVHEPLTVKFDLKEQQYWTERMPEPKDDEEDEDEPKNPTAEMSTLDLLSVAQKAMDPEAEHSEDDEKALEEQANRLNKQFERIQRQALLAQAEHVVHDGEGKLGEKGLFGDDEGYDETEDGEKIEPEVVTEPVLLRAAMPKGVFIESILVGEKRTSKGLVEIPIGPLGLTEPVELVVGNDEGEYYTVVWDAITGDARFYEGKKVPDRDE